LVNERLPELKSKTNNYKNFAVYTKEAGTDRKKDLNSSFNNTMPNQNRT